MSLQALAIQEGWCTDLVERVFSAKSERLARLRTAARDLTVVVFNASQDEDVIRVGLCGPRTAFTLRDIRRLSLDYNREITSPKDWESVVLYVDLVGGGGGHGDWRAVRALTAGLGVRDLSIGGDIDAKAAYVEGSTAKCMAVCEKGHWALAVRNVSLPNIMSLVHFD